MFTETPNISKKIVIVVSTIIGTSTVLAVYYYKKFCKKITIWEPIGRVESLYIYPLKSGHRNSIERAECTEFGLRFLTSGLSHLRDRCLVVYKEETKAFQTARNYPKLLLIKTTVCDIGFLLSSSYVQPFFLEIPTPSNSFKDEIIMWNGEKVFTIDCGDESAKWISTVLLGSNFGLRLGYHDGFHKRNIKKFHERYIKLHPKLKNATSGMYSDLSTILLLTKSSVNDVISRIPNSNITEHNFRSNIIVQDNNIQPYSEDKWDKIKIGDVVLKNIMPCARCSITTINPETATSNENFEPITTMKTFRTLTKYNSGLTYPNLGIYMSLEHFGHIRVGDIVYISKL